MTTAKHTPAQLAIIGRQTKTEIKGFFAIGVGGECIAYVAPNLWPQWLCQSFNSHHELVEALEAARIAMSKAAPSALCDACDRVLPQVEAALSKAKGEA